MNTTVLPISEYKNEILSMLSNKQTIIIVGADQSKMIPQYLYENSGSDDGKTIVCTEPRRLLAINNAEKVSKQLNSEVGKLVGYGIRFEEKSGSTTSIKYVTDGLLIREMMIDPLLSNYSVILIDEASKRSLNTDVLIGLLKNLQMKRPDLKLIISCELGCNQLIIDEFSKFFKDAGIISIKGKEGNSVIRLPNVVPEIQTVELTTLVLQLKAMGIDNIMDFNLVSYPTKESVDKSLELLKGYNAIDENGSLTSTGRSMVELPIEPSLSSMLIQSIEKYGCNHDEMLSIISMLTCSKQTVFINDKCNEIVDKQSDQLSLLNIFKSFIKHSQTDTELESWCDKYGIDSKSMKKVVQVKQQLFNCFNKLSIKSVTQSNQNENNSDKIKKSILSGCFNNVAELQSNGSYKTIKSSQSVWLNPTSVVSLNSQLPQFVIFNDITKTTTDTDKQYMNSVTVINQAWL